MKNASELIIYGDGGSRGNPGEAAYGFAVYDTEKKEVYKEGKRLGIATNNFAEYSAVISALMYVKTHNPNVETIRFYLDSQLVASQLSGVYKVKHPSMKELFIKAKQLETSLSAKITYTAIPRSENTAADQLVNEALDGKR